MDIQLPDGTILQGIPDGTTKMQIRQKLVGLGVDPTFLNTAKSEDVGYSGPTGTQGKMFGMDVPVDVTNFLAGAGKGMTDVVRGIGQMLPGGPTRADIGESRRLDQPLMNTKAGVAGDITGQVAATAPTAFIPGAATLRGASLIGGGLGLAQPSTSTGETVRNAALGSVLAPATLLGGRALGATYQAGKATLEPLFKGGQERIAARTLQSFAGGPQAAAKVIADIDAGGAKAFTPGVLRTLAESTDNAGISQLQRTLENNPELLPRFAEIAKNNRASIVDAIDSMTDQGQRAFFEAMRDTTAQSMYKKAWSAGFNEKQLAKLQPQISELMQRPSIVGAVGKAKQIAAEEGQQLDSIGSMKGLHYVKKALEDMLDSAKDTGIGNIQRRAITGTRDQLIAIMDKISKGNAYPKARAEYEALSKPINQIDVAQTLRDKLIPALADYGDTTKLAASSYAQALRSGDETAKRALGYQGATMANVMEPGQLKMLEGIAKDLAARSAAQNRGRAVGSNTAQNLVAQNFMRQLLGPLGLPHSMTERAAQSSLMQTVLRPIQFTGKIGEERVLGLLGQAAADPQKAKSLLQAAQADPGLAAALSQTAQRYLPSRAAGLLGGANASQQ